MKLNEQAPEQHMAILVVAGIFVFLSLVEQFKSSPAQDELGKNIRKGPYAQTGQTLYNNPELSWYEKYLCRGYQRSSFCSDRLQHPFNELFKANGITVKAEPSEKVVDYRGPLPSNKAISSKILLQNDS